jgi:hypothetical protein
MNACFYQYFQYPAAHVQQGIHQMRKLMFAFVAAALAVPAFAASDTPPASGASDQAQPPKKEKKICKRAGSTESRIATMECRTAAEWARNPTITGSRSSISASPETPDGH